MHHATLLLLVQLKHLEKIITGNNRLNTVFLLYFLQSYMLSKIKIVIISKCTRLQTGY